MSDTNEKDTEVDILARNRGESEVAHRSFLLYAMQSEKRRNMRATARAVERSNTTVRNYSKSWDWAKRMDIPHIEVKAQELYKSLYFAMYGMREIAMIEKYILSPVTVVGSTPRSVADTVTRVVEQSNPKKSQVFTDELKRKHLTLVDAGIGYIAQGIKNGDLKRSLRDLPLLMQLRREITGENKEEKESAILVESVRVKTAKSMGTDIVEAMYEDAQELVAILGALASAKQVPTHAEILQEVKDE